MRVYFTDPVDKCIRVDTIDAEHLNPESIYRLGSQRIVSGKWLHADYISALECLLDIVMESHKWDQLPRRTICSQK